MLKRFSLIMILIVSPSLMAEDLSDQCVQSVQNLYKFYFHEIQPKEKYDHCQKVPETLDSHAALEMKIVVSELKTHCPGTLVVKMNQLLMTPNAATSAGQFPGQNPGQFPAQIPPPSLGQNAFPEQEETEDQS